jgi:hypothetical protein
VWFERSRLRDGPPAIRQFFIILLIFFVIIFASEQKLFELPGHVELYYFKPIIMSVEVFK